MTHGKTINVGLVGVGGIAEYVHYPGIQTVPDARVVAMTDPNGELLGSRAKLWPDVLAYADAEALLQHPDLDAVIIATPNFMHAPLASLAIQAGKHVLVEKPIALTAAEALRMLQAARQANVRHMTAFTYRFVPAMQYLKHLLKEGALGEILHFRAQRFQDWHTHSLGWRQWKETAGTGELGDMASHRIDYGRFLIGEIKTVCGMMKQFLPRDTDTEGNTVKPSDTDDWVALVFEFENGVTGVVESSKLMRGHGSGGQGHDFVEVNGTEGSAIYELRHPYQLRLGKRDGGFTVVEVPKALWKRSGSLREAGEGDSSVVWRYDQELEFVTAIRESRDCVPSFQDGVRCQEIIEAVLTSVQQHRWVDVASIRSDA